MLNGSATVTESYTSVSAMLSDRQQYGAGIDRGDVIRVGDFYYEVAASRATDHHLETKGGVKLYAVPLDDGSIHSSQLGWKADQDISADFARLADKVFKSGDIFVLDHMYDISGRQIELPNNFTLAGADGGGLDVQDTKTNLKPLLELGHRNTIQDLTVTHSNELPSGTKSDKITFLIEDKNDVQILNTSFEGNVGIFVQVAGGEGLVVKDSHFDGAYYQMRWAGGTVDPYVENTLFENSAGDGIKTSRGNREGVQGAEIVDSVFINNRRDGIDTTGGFKDSRVTDSYFISNGVSALDIKTVIEGPEDLNPDLMNKNIVIEGSVFVDHGNTIVVTTLDRAGLLKGKDKLDWTAQDIYLRDSIVEGQANKNSRVFLVKDSHSIYMEDVELLGRLNEGEAATKDAFGIEPFNLVNTDVTLGDPRIAKQKIDYASLAGTDRSVDVYSLDNPTKTPKFDDDSQVTEIVPPTSMPDQVEADAPPPPKKSKSQPEPAPVVTLPDPSDDDAEGYLEVYLADIATDELLVRLDGTTTLDASVFAGREVTLTALAADDGVGSVRLKADGIGSRVENVAPYALFGDSKGDYKKGFTLEVGEYDFDVIAYSGKGGRGLKLETLNIDVTVGEVTGGGGSPDPVTTPPGDVSVPPAPKPQPVVYAPETDLEYEDSASDSILDISLVLTKSDREVASLDGDTVVSADAIAKQKVTVAATAADGAPAIGSVRLEMKGVGTRTENVEPYALFGDRNGDYSGGITLDEGSYSVTLKAYSGKNGTGNLLETVTRNFEVGDVESVAIDGSLRALDSFSAAQDTGTASASGNGRTVTLNSNAWKTIEINETITKDSVLSFDFKSSAEGEIHGIGFINPDGSLADTFFQLDGDQLLGNQDFNGSYSTGSGFSSYRIDVGKYFTGEYRELVLVTDNDAGGNANSVFRDISVFDFA